MISIFAPLKRYVDNAIAAHVTAHLASTVATKEAPMSAVDPSPVAPAAPSSIATTLSGLFTGPVQNAIEQAVLSAAVPALISAINSQASAGIISADVQKLLIDVTTAITDAKAGKLGVVDIAQTVEDIAAAAIALEAKPVAPSAAAAV